MNRTKVIVLAAALICAAEARTQPPQGPTIDEIAAKWKQRQDAIKTFRIAWTQTAFQPAGSYSDAHPSSTGKGVVFPKSDTTLHQRGSIFMDQEKARFEFYGHAYSTITSDFVEHSYTALYDGQTGAHLREGVETGVTVVSRQQGAPPRHLNSTTTSLILRAFRPTTAKVSGLDLDQFVVRRTNVMVNSVPCVELGLRAAPTGVTTSIWLDPARDYHMIRHQQVLAEGSYSLMQYDISYSRDIDGRWVPAGWAHVRKGRSGQILSTTKAVVTECVIDGPIAKSTFDPTPPPSSRVTETNRDGKTETYIVRPDGSRREQVKGEESVGFDTLVATVPGEPIGQPQLSWWGRNWVILSGMAAFILGLVGVVRWRLRSRSGSRVNA